MDWLEQWLGINPDGGTGTVEAEIVVAITLAIAAGVLMCSPSVRAFVETAIKKATSRVRAGRHS